MPPIASVVVDQQGASLVSAWIQSLATPVDPKPLPMQFGFLTGSLRITVDQPAGRAVQLQSTSALLGRGSWEWVDVPGNEYFVPENSGRVEWSVPIDQNNSRYFRAVILDP
jgi:hypothetical protein